MKQYIFGGSVKIHNEIELYGDPFSVITSILKMTENGSVKFHNEIELYGDPFSVIEYNVNGSVKFHNEIELYGDPFSVIDIILKMTENGSVKIIPSLSKI